MNINQDNVNPFEDEAEAYGTINKALDPDEIGE